MSEHTSHVFPDHCFPEIDGLEYYRKKWPMPDQCIPLTEEEARPQLEMAVKFLYKFPPFDAGDFAIKADIFGFKTISMVPEGEQEPIFVVEVWLNRRRLKSVTIPSMCVTGFCRIAEMDFT